MNRKEKREANRLEQERFEEDYRNAITEEWNNSTEYYTIDKRFYSNGEIKFVVLRHMSDDYTYKIIKDEEFITYGDAEAFINDILNRGV